MPSCPLALTRPVVWVLTGLTALAIFLGRGAREGREDRRPSPVRQHAINWYLFRKADRTPRFLDAETGRLSPVSFPGSGSLEYASCSPWRDDRGQSQLVGLWTEASGSGDHDGGIAMARFTFPGRELLDRVPLDVIPAGVPCWYPGTSPVVLFGATDGQLYRLAFAETPGGRADGEREGDQGRPHRLAWRCTPPGGAG